MNPAVKVIFLALIFYTIGVWAEKIQKDLKPWHLATFWLGFICDTIGTSAMGNIFKSISKLEFHGISGLLAILLMFFHAIWASIVIYRNNKTTRANFHKFSIIVWLIWLIPMFSPVFFGMG